MIHYGLKMHFYKITTCNRKEKNPKCVMMSKELKDNNETNKILK